MLTVLTAVRIYVCTVACRLINRERERVWNDGLASGGPNASHPHPAEVVYSKSFVRSSLHFPPIIVSRELSTEPLKCVYCVV